MGQLCTEILMRPERRHGVERAKRNKPHRQKKKSKYAFAKTTYIHRKQGTTKWAGFRIPTTGWTKEKGNGMQFHYNFRCEKELGPKFAFFAGSHAVAKDYFEILEEPIATRYSGPSDSYHL